MAITILSNDEVIEGKGTSKGATAYRLLVAEHGHDALCAAYRIDVDSHWRDVVGQAYLWGDIDSEGQLT